VERQASHSPVSATLQGHQPPGSLGEANKMGVQGGLPATGCTSRGRAVLARWAAPVDTRNALVGLHGLVFGLTCDTGNAPVGYYWPQFLGAVDKTNSSTRGQ
jgi:hypothetical protein